MHLLMSALWVILKILCEFNELTRVRAIPIVDPQAVW